MTISFVGSGGQANGAGTDIVYSFSSLLNEAGVAPTLQQGDLVVVAVAYRTASTTGEWDKTPNDGTTNYTPAFPDVFQTNTQALSFKVSYKFMGATPDASVTVPAGATTTSSCFSVHVFRGVDTTTPLDVTPTTATATGTVQPDAPAITPATAGAWIFVAGAYSTGSSHVVLTAPAGLNSAANDYQSYAASTSVIGAGFYSGWTSGAYNPAAFTGGTTFGGSAEAAATIALRPLSGGGGGRTGTASGALPLTGSGATKALLKASAASAVDLSGSAAAKVALRGAAASTFGLSGAATAADPVKGAASGSLPLNGAASLGAQSAHGAVSGAMGFSGSGTGRALIQGAANDDFELTGAAAGDVHIAGGGAGAFALTGAAVGRIANVSTTPSSRVAKVDRVSRTAKVSRVRRVA